MARWDRQSAATGQGMSKPAGRGDGSGSQDAIRPALTELTPEQRLMCIWRKAGFSEIEIANHLGCPADRVAGQFSRVSAVLRRAVQAFRGQW